MGVEMLEVKVPIIVFRYAGMDVTLVLFAVLPLFLFILPFLQSRFPSENIVHKQHNGLSHPAIIFCLVGMFLH